MNFKIESFDTIPDYQNKSIVVDIVFIDDATATPMKVDAVLAPTKGVEVVVQGISCAFIFTPKDIQDVTKMTTILLNQLYKTIFAIIK